MMPRHRLLVFWTLCSVLLCLALISLVDHWTTPSRAPPLLEPKRITEEFKTTSQDLDLLWEQKYERRVQHVREACEHDEVAAMRRVWRVAANRRFGKEVPCPPGNCPVIVDEQKVLFFCFVPGVASTAVKRFFLNISGVALNESVSREFLHSVADDRLRRVSPMYYPSTTANRFFKILFVRHPFQRLVSVFRDMAERPKDQVQHFYDRYWNPLMKKLRDPGSPTDQVTFSEFVWLLTHSPIRDYDRRWVPYWSRCDPCLVDYDFVGKAETAERDFPYAFRKVGIESEAAWWRNRGGPNTTRALAMRYFSTVPEESVRKLYDVYKLDFDLFEYSAEGFLPLSKTTEAPV